MRRRRLERPRARLPPRTQPPLSTPLARSIFVFAPSLALQLILGRTLTVGAGKAPGVAPLISQTGALRLAL